MLILASQSPRRAELLRNAGVAFRVQPADIDESLMPDESALDYVQRLAREKAEVVLSSNPSSLVLGADTTVVIDNQSLGKPADEEDAKRMLRRLSGRWHQVITGVCLAWQSTDQQIETDVRAETTEVEFTAMSEEEIAAYVEGKEPLDKAGAYGIQGQASRWIPRINGCYFNVVGLPVATVHRMLKEHADRGSR